MLDLAARRVHDRHQFHSRARKIPKKLIPIKAAMGRRRLGTAGGAPLMRSAAL
jgi:hypothetical protein